MDLTFCPGQAEVYALFLSYNVAENKMFEEASEKKEI